jgi:hypothetical protein
MPTFFPFIQPDVCSRIPVRTTVRNVLGQQVIAARKKYDVYHRITYIFDSLSARQYRIINNHFRSVDGGVTSFYVIDWSNPRPISAISGLHVTINNTQGFSVNSGDGGNNIVLWQNSGDYGNNNTVSNLVITDKSKAWTANEWQKHKIMDSVGTEYSASVNTENTLTITSGTPVAGAYDIYQYVHTTIASINTSLRRLTLAASPVLSYERAWEKFVLPVYKCHYSADELGIEPTGEFNTESSDNYGPYYSGQIEFIQRGTGT